MGSVPPEEWIRLYTEEKGVTPKDPGHLRSFVSNRGGTLAFSQARIAIASAVKDCSTLANANSSASSQTSFPSSAPSVVNFVRSTVPQTPAVVFGNGSPPQERTKVAQLKQSFQAVSQHQPSLLQPPQQQQLQGNNSPMKVASATNSKLIKCNYGGSTGWIQTPTQGVAFRKDVAPGKLVMTGQDSSNRNLVRNPWVRQADTLTMPVWHTPPKTQTDDVTTSVWLKSAKPESNASLPNQASIAKAQRENGKVGWPLSGKLPLVEVSSKDVIAPANHASDVATRSAEEQAAALYEQRDAASLRAQELYILSVCSEGPITSPCSKWPLLPSVSTWLIHINPPRDTTAQLLREQMDFTKDDDAPCPLVGLKPTNDPFTEDNAANERIQAVSSNFAAKVMDEAESKVGAGFAAKVKAEKEVVAAEVGQQQKEAGSQKTLQPKSLPKTSYFGTRCRNETQVPNGSLHVQPLLPQNFQQDKNVGNSQTGKGLQQILDERRAASEAPESPSPPKLNMAFQGRDDANVAEAQRPEPASAAVVMAVSTFDHSQNLGQNSDLESAPDMLLGSIPTLAPSSATASTACTPVLNAAMASAEASLSIGLLFPNEGSSQLGMMKGVDSLPHVADLVARANAVLGYDVVQLCVQGPAAKLQQIKYSQPAMYVADLVAAERLCVDNPDALKRCRAVAGLGVGEFAALTVAGVWDMELGLEFVKLRAQAMEDVGESVSGLSLLTITGLELEKVRELCEEAQRNSVEGAVCSIQSMLLPSGYICAGTEAAISRLKVMCESIDHGDGKGVSAKFLESAKGAAAFQTSLMEPVRQCLQSAMTEAIAKMRPPRCMVYFNSTGNAVPAGVDPACLVELLTSQITSTILWVPAVEMMISDGVEEFYELGPGRQLRSFMQRINTKSWRKTKSVQP